MLQAARGPSDPGPSDPGPSDPGPSDPRAGPSDPEGRGERVRHGGYSHEYDNDQRLLRQVRPGRSRRPVLWQMRP